MNECVLLVRGVSVLLVRGVSADGTSALLVRGVSAAPQICRPPTEKGQSTVPVHCTGNCAAAAANWICRPLNAGITYMICK